MYVFDDKVLEHMKDSEFNDIRVIGISSLMTWEGLKAFETEQDGEDK